MSRSVILYRVVDRDGYGYKRSLDSNIGSSCIMDYSNYESRRPLPENDGINLLRVGPSWLFAFSSMEQYKRWFELDERNAGAFHGGQLQSIEVDSDHVIYGANQAAFDSAHAKVIDQHYMNAFDTPEDQMKPFDPDNECVLPHPDEPKEVIALHTDFKWIKRDFVPRIRRLLHTNRFPLTDEKETQAAIAELFVREGVPFEREVSLTKDDIVDFMVYGTIGIEVKLKGQRKKIFAQLSRYAQHERVEQLILLTAASMGLPEEIEGKPAYVMSLGQGWL
ncbi:hypothetical protein ACI2KR_27045 [Pseudomonas luteola]